MNAAERRPELIGRTYVAEFLVQAQNVDPNKVSSMAHDLLLRLMYDAPEILFVCYRCGQQRGVCRCGQHGFQLGSRWHYKSRATPWLCVVESLLSIDESVLDRFGPKTRQRLQMLIAYLRWLRP